MLTHSYAHSAEVAKWLPLTALGGARVRIPRQDKQCKHLPSFEGRRTERVVNFISVQCHLTQIQSRLDPAVPRLWSVTCILLLSQVPLESVPVTTAIVFRGRCRLRRRRRLGLTTLVFLVPVVAVRLGGFAIDGDALVGTLVPLPFCMKRLGSGTLWWERGRQRAFWTGFAGRTFPGRVWFVGETCSGSLVPPSPFTVSHLIQ